MTLREFHAIFEKYLSESPDAEIWIESEEEDGPRFAYTIESLEIGLSTAGEVRTLTVVVK